MLRRLGTSRFRSRRGFLRGRPTAGAQPVSPTDYAEWVEAYRAGRFRETARRVSGYRADALREAQRRFLDSLPPRDDFRSFGSRLAPAVLHAEAMARFGVNESSHIGLLDDPCRSLPERWIVGLPASYREEAHAAWGDRAASDPRRVLFREAVLAAARPRLAILAVADATQILEEAGPDHDPVIRWQLAAVWAFRARYVREASLWDKAREIYEARSVRGLIPSDVGAASSRLVARAMSDPDDQNLRLAFTQFGLDRPGDAESSLGRLRPELWPRLRVPHRLLAGKALMDRGQFRPASDMYRMAVEDGPQSQIAAAALVAALQASGRLEEAAALSRDWLSGTFARGVHMDTHPWLTFLLTWAQSRGPDFEWLRSLVAT